MAEITRKRTGKLLRRVFQILSGEPDVYRPELILFGTGTGVRLEDIYVLID